MLLITYDITDDKLRTKFAEFLSQYGERVQFSVFRIRNSQRILNNIEVEIEKKYRKRFKDTDSVYVFMICEACKQRVMKFGNAVYEDKEVLYL